MNVDGVWKGSNLFDKVLGVKVTNNSHPKPEGTGRDKISKSYKYSTGQDMNTEKSVLIIYWILCKE